MIKLEKKRKYIEAFPNQSNPYKYNIKITKLEKDLAYIFIKLSQIEISRTDVDNKETQKNYIYNFLNNVKLDYNLKYPEIIEIPKNGKYKNIKYNTSKNKYKITIKIKSQKYK